MGKFKERWLREYLINLRERDRAISHPCRGWVKGEVALLKLPNKSRPHWPLCKVVDIFPDGENVIRTVRVSRADGKEAVVNVGQLIPLELYAELNDPNLQNIEGASAQPPVDVEDVYLNSDIIFSDGEDLGDGEDGPEVDESSEGARPSRSTTQASRANMSSGSSGPRLILFLSDTYFFE